jgi:hypothetical protein
MKPVLIAIFAFDDDDGDDGDIHAYPDYPDHDRGHDPSHGDDTHLLGHETQTCQATETITKWKA